MAEPAQSPDHVEALAFQLVLQKLTALEQALYAVPPLLKKIIDHLEAQSKQPDVPVATYAQLYPELQDATEEEEEEDNDSAPPETTALPASPAPSRPGRLWHWFTKEA